MTDPIEAPGSLDLDFSGRRRFIRFCGRMHLCAGLWDRWDLVSLMLVVPRLC
jgi:hypothetical protein